MNNYQINDIVILKKNHPCAKNKKEFKVLSIDGEVHLKCLNCGGIIFLKRNAFEKALVRSYHEEKN